MLLDTPNARLTLQHNELARFAGACDTRVDCVDGVAWITIDGDRRDIVLSRGESFVVDSSAPVIVHAIQGPAAVELHAKAGTSRCRPAAVRPARRWHDWFAAPAAHAAEAA
jgi:hypothetical protein